MGTAWVIPLARRHLVVAQLMFWLGVQGVACIGLRSSWYKWATRLYFEAFEVRLSALRAPHVK